ncbi:LOW QUALITY PROTEIN: actin remodeling regulator NHS [Menidia menidia]
MPFAKRAVGPQLLCRYRIPNEEGLVFEDLVSISNVALSRTLRQLSDLARHACSIFQELESDLATTSQRVRGLQGKVNRLQQACSELDPKQEAVPVSDLDVESKLTVHFQAPWHQHRNVFHPSTRPACVEELHRQANFSGWPLDQDPHRRPSGSRERRVTISSLPPMPMYPSPDVTPRPDKRATSPTALHSTRSSSPTECCHLSPWSRKAAPSDPDSDGVALGHRSKFPIPNIPSTLDKQTNWSKALPLPTPEERMKSNSQVITSCVIPINVTGLGFDRDASVRCSLVHSQSLLQRRRKLRRRRTVAGVPRQVQQDLDSDDSPGSRERTVIVHSGPSVTPSGQELARHLGTRDSGCQTEEFLISGAPSRRRVRVHRGQGASLLLSRSAGNISCLPDGAGAMFAASVGARLRSRSLPRDASRALSNGRSDEEDEEDEEEEEEEEGMAFDGEGFLPGRRERIRKDEGESPERQAMSERRLVGLKFRQLSERPACSWMERGGGGGARLPRRADAGSCEISSSSDTFGSPVHSVSAGGGVLGGQLDPKEDHQSSSGNWSGSSSTCPSQTSETIPPAASPPLTGSSHCDSELSLNAASHAADDPAGFALDHYQGLRTQRAGSFSSTAMDILEEAGACSPAEGEWGGYPRPDPSSRPLDFSPEPGREADSSLGCPSFASMATCESSFSDKPPSEKADSVSHYSVDTEGYYTSMHFDCGLKGSRSFPYGCAAAAGPDCDLTAHLTLGRRCLSLRKPKAKPSPPKRSSSLRKICSEGSIPDKKEPKISCGQTLPLTYRERRLQLALAREPGAAWGARGAGDLSDLGVFGSTDGRSFKEEGAVQADYSDLWLLNDFRSGDPYRSLSNSSTATGTTVVECVRSQESSESQASRSGSGSGSGSGNTTPSLPSAEGDFKLTSPERLAGLASPSSGYSSQSETPTSSFPAAFFPGPASPASGKRKPKVPERKSSLSSLSLQSRSCRDAATSKRDLELPVVPPSHLDLSVLHAVNDQAAAKGTWNRQDNKPASDPHPLSITPSVLHSVQLRPVGKNPKEVRGDSGPQRAALNGVPSELKRPPEPAEEESDGEPDRGDATFELFSSQKVAALPESPPGQEEEPPIGPESGPHSEPPADLTEEETALPPPALHSSPQRNASPVFGTRSQPETNQEISICEGESDSSGVSAESPSQDSKAESPAETDSSPSDHSMSPPHDESRPEEDSVFLSPSKSRTTEDLFAMIHRSKRKLLGRKDSSELGVKSRLGAVSGTPPPGSVASSPVPQAPPPCAATPPPAAATPAAGAHRSPGAIYRSARKSSTSSEEFKLLLLRKGSRSDSSYRMSATEILRSPAGPRSPGEPPTESPRQPEEPASPLGGVQEQPSSPYPKANANTNESFSPKSFQGSAASSRQGRPRIPPPANSSRYSARSRLYSAPMQAISEGETENSDGSPHDDRSSQGSV